MKFRSSRTVPERPAPPAPPRVRRPEEFATRNCVHCSHDLSEDERLITCPKCGRRSEVAFCKHLTPEPSWRIIRWRKAESNHGRRDRDVVAVTVGDATVFLGRFRDALALRGEDGARLPLKAVHSVEPGAEIIERMTKLGTCYRCDVAFFLPDCEIQASGPPRVLRIPLPKPTREYQRPTPSPVHIHEAYLTLGTRQLDEEEL